MTKIVFTMYKQKSQHNSIKSPIISKKHDILNLILSNCKTDEKNLVYPITKPFDKLFKTPETDKWCYW